MAGCVVAVSPAGKGRQEGGPLPDWPTPESHIAGTYGLVPRQACNQSFIIEVAACTTSETASERYLMMRKLYSAALVFTLLLPAFAKDKEEKDTARLEESAVVLKEILGMPEGIPKDLLDKSVCVVVYPSVKKAAFVVGASYGRGAITCRSGKELNGAWSAPAMFALEGGSFGFQIGAQATDFVLLIMNESGANSVMSSKVKIGADASAAAGPVGRNTSAETDVVMKAEILSYSRAKGLFAGVSLEGSTLRSDDGANKALYGKEISAKEIVRQGKVTAPAASKRLLAILTKASPKHAVSKSD
jgi:SH3 domain-containing YSC84-like protein 1